jgi:hypothetical protein
LVAQGGPRLDLTDDQDDLESVGTSAPLHQVDRRGKRKFKPTRARGADERGISTLGMQREALATSPCADLDQVAGLAEAHA